MQPPSGEESVQTKCTCGHGISTMSAAEAAFGTSSHTLSAFQGVSPAVEKLAYMQEAPGISFSPLDASFVQIPASLVPRQQHLAGGSDCERGASVARSNRSESLRGLSCLQAAATNPKNPPMLCFSCVQRVEKALDADSDRLQAEAEAYNEAVLEDKARVKAWKQTIKRAASAFPSEEGEEVLSGDPYDAERSLEDAFRHEIDLLEEACQQHRDELAHLRALRKEQAMAFLELDLVHDAMAEEQNDLELAARAFDNDQEQLSRALAEIQDEVDRLSSAEIKLPATLLHLQVDAERGLRYPLINELRLAYRPKGDLQWKEISAAWALAAQLLLMIGTLFQFQSQHWKIVPLSHCAKLIYCPPVRNDGSEGGAEQKNRPIVFNLGHPKTNGSRALLTWNALLCQMVQHVTSKLSVAAENGIMDASDIPPVPFAITPTTIGNIALTKLDDEAGEWSRVTHLMASNLLWLSECSSRYIRQQVLLSAPLVGGDVTATVSDSAPDVVE